MRRVRWLAVALGAALVLGGVAAGCGDDDGGGTGGDVGDLKIGILVPLTGALADFGPPAQKGGELGVAELNKAAQASGVSLNVTSVSADTETDARPAQLAATKVVEADDVRCLAGPMASSEVISVAQNVTIAAGIPVISPSSTASNVRTEITDDGGTVYRVPPPDSLQGPLLAQQIYNETNGGTVNVAGQNDAYGTGLIADFVPAYEKLGGTVGAQVTFNPAATNLNAEARQMAAGNPAALAIFTFPATWSKLGPALQRTGNYDPKKTWGTDGLRSVDLPKSGASLVEGMRGTAPTDKGNTLAPAFQQLWDASKLGTRQTFDVQMFDAAVLCGLAAVAAGSSDPKEIAAKVREVSGPPGTAYTFQQLGDALTALKNGDDIDYQGASGPIDLAENGDPGVGDYVIWTYEDGKLVDSDEVVKAETE